MMKTNFGIAAIMMLATASQVFGRFNLVERDGRAIFLARRRFGQENSATLQLIREACPGGTCAVFAGQAISTLLAGSPECAQQDLADDIIDASKDFDAETADKMVAAAIDFRQAEKNTPPDFSTNPPTARNSVFCQKAPRNQELNGLVQAQDPANDPELFFDPATKSTVVRGSQPNTEPFSG
ncbi:hypothetical protein BJ165DRAFT_1428327 [Panaeolus papilionaceus]|nr:hypothetical protein BJ165DRAFT_1428327 [Panaeolus papilionaceus]